MTHDYGPQRAEVFTRWIFDSTQNDQIGAVLRKLAADRHLGKSIGAMPAAKASLARRGIDLATISDRDWQASDLGRGAWGFVTDALDTIPLARDSKGFANTAMINDLPPAYGDALWNIEVDATEKAMSPGSVAYGAVDYLSFGTISTVHGVVTGTASGLKNLARGEYEDAVHDLLPALLIVGTLAAGKAIRTKARKATALEATALEAATLDATLARLEPASANALRALLTEFGEDGIRKAAGFIERDSAAATLVGKHKAPGVRALIDADGDVLKATGLLKERVQVAKLPDGNVVPPDGFGTVFHGTDQVPPGVAFDRGLPGRGTNVDLDAHAQGTGNSAFRGSSTLAMTPDGLSGPGHGAGAGGWVYKIEGMPSWDVNRHLEGRRPVGGGFAGNLMSGEAEHAIPARVPPERIMSAYPVIEGPGSKLRLGTEIQNPKYKPRE